MHKVEWDFFIFRHIEIGLNWLYNYNIIVYYVYVIKIFWEEKPKMKKTLSIILSLLMVLSTVTCLFTMPVSAEEAATEAPAEVETLPVTDLLRDGGQVRAGKITPESTFQLGGFDCPTSAHYNVTGWNAVYQYVTDENGEFVLDEKGEKIIAKDENGKDIILSGRTDSYILVNTLYQFTFNVTVSEDVNEGVKLYPIFHSQASQNWPFNVFAGVRNEVGSAATETAYNYKTNISGNPNGENKLISTLTKENAAALVPGKTYTYTYFFKLPSGCSYINYLRIFADGLTAGTVTVGNAKLFPYADTDAYKYIGGMNIGSDNYGTLPYAVEEDGNVFTRVYGYRNIDDTTVKAKDLIFKGDGGLYNLTLKGGNTYNLNMDFRITTTQTTANSPTFNYIIPAAIDYTEAFNELKAEAGTTETDTATYKVGSTSAHADSTKGYSYFYAAKENFGTYSRRVFPNLATIKFYSKADGSLLANPVEHYGSGQGRGAKTAIYNKGWMSTIYSVNAPEGQTIKEAAIAGASSSTSKSDQYMRYTYKDGVWNYDATQKAYYVPAAKDEVVFFVLANLYSGSVYDIDNIALLLNAKTHDVQYVNKAGETVTVTDTVIPTATSGVDVLENKTNLNVNFFNNDVYTFKGWYDGDTLVSANTNDVLEGEYANLKVVIETKNLLTNAGGFENYTANTTSLEAPYTMVNTEKYPNYTGGATDNRRFYNGLPTGDKWTGWDGNVKLSGITDSDNGVTKAKIVADIETAGGVIDTTGWTGFTHFLNFPTVLGATTVRTYKDAGNKYVDETAHAVTPYSGKKMLRIAASTRTGYRALEGLTPGTTYTVSFYAYNPYAYYFLKDVAVVEQPRYGMGNAAAGVKQLAGYTTPYTVVTEDIHNADGTVASTPKDIQKANAEYVKKWYKIELTFKATAEVAYLAVSNQHKNNTSGYTYIDELTLVEYECNGKHNYNSIADTHCTVCGEARVYKTAWDFEDGSMENIVNGSGTINVVDAADQPAKIGSKYLEYTSKGWTGIAFNFPYEQGYKYTISYDFKIFTYGTGATANGIDGLLIKYDDGAYGALDQTAAPLNPGSENIITRYWEDGTRYEKVTGFSQANNNYIGRQSKDGVFLNAMSTVYGPSEMWDGWQHFEIEVGSNNDYEGLLEYGIRGNDSGWVLGIDNFKVEKVAMATINEADEATAGTYALNIRAKTVDKKQGLRFKSTIDLDALNLADGAKIVEYGTLAAKKTDVDAGYYLRREGATDMVSKGKVIAGVAYNAENGTDVRYALDDETNVLTYTGVLTGIGIKNYDVDFVVCGYAIVETADGQRITVYDDAVTFSVYDAALAIIENNDKPEDVTVAQNVVNTYEAYLAQQQ